MGTWIFFSRSQPPHAAPPTCCHPPEGKQQLQQQRRGKKPPITPGQSIGSRRLQGCPGTWPSPRKALSFSAGPRATRPAPRPPFLLALGRGPNQLPGVTDSGGERRGKPAERDSFPFSPPRAGPGAPLHGMQAHGESAFGIPQTRRRRREPPACSGAEEDAGCWVQTNSQGSHRTGSPAGGKAGGGGLLGWGMLP